LAEALAHDQPLTLALDVDGIKHSLGQWHKDPLASGLHARRLTLALAREQLSAGHDVVVGQYLARTDFIRSPSRPEHLVSNSLVGPDDADLLVKSLEGLRETRPRAVWVAAQGSLPDTLDLLRAALH